MGNVSIANQTDNALHVVVHLTGLSTYIHYNMTEFCHLPCIGNLGASNRDKSEKDSKVNSLSDS